MKDQIRERNGEEEKYRRNDVLDLMLRVRDEQRERDPNAVTMTDHFIARTCMQFFLDGYDTVTTQLAMSFYFLALNREAQVRLQLVILCRISRVLQ